MFYNILLVVHVINALLLIVIVLLQTGKGSEVGFAFGAGAANTMFGAGGSKTFITKATIFVAVLFMVTSLTLALMQSRRSGQYSGVLDSVKQQQSVPAADQVPASAPVSETK
ncbi:MAG TPA: preprotein translocase subunit SecG [Candidatus Goldiibacteriota bacterium]|nr:preprotein translocase subunit SecG [Candidatus Goldiibacteriota bacterium]HPI03777.1 preprotein translocase subunit SecG [Candidatus Goldiibacteriota bacterium]HPN65718.1 preprotein translocase subunit SecG [Candidatus Goldiibacteriota bacterium]HRQ44538.1 preprotein translocase subunit SecG [Candidatus Goldiibacteriota bacterium]